MTAIFSVHGRDKNELDDISQVETYVRDILKQVHNSCQINLMSKWNSPEEQTIHIQENQTNFHSQYLQNSIILWLNLH